MISLNEMTREELLEIVKIKDKMIQELKEEVISYQILIRQLQKDMLSSNL